MSQSIRQTGNQFRLREADWLPLLPDLGGKVDSRPQAASRTHARIGALQRDNPAVQINVDAVTRGSLDGDRRFQPDDRVAGRYSRQFLPGKLTENLRKRLTRPGGREN